MDLTRTEVAARKRGAAARFALLAAPVAFFAVFFAYPVAAIVARGLKADGTWHLGRIGEVLAQSDFLDVLNQADLLSPGEIDDWRQDVSRLLANDGLPAMPVLVVSARTGEGLDSLRRLLAERVAARDAAVARLRSR